MNKKKKDTGSKRGHIRLISLVQLAIVLAIIILANYLGSFFFYRLDLTADKRYTLKDYTIEMLEGLDEDFFIKVYLKDDGLPPNVARLRQSIRETLEDFKAYGGGHIEYTFEDPLEGLEGDRLREVMQQLGDMQIQVIDLQSGDMAKKASQIIVPGAVIYYRGAEIGVNFLKDEPDLSPEDDINKSIQWIEYELVNAMDYIRKDPPQRILFVEGHGELSPTENFDLRRTLSQSYMILEPKAIDHQLNAFDGVDLAVIAGPEKPFDEMDKYIIDQFIMHGGKVLWLLDGVQAEMDSIAYNNMTLALPNEINLGDMLFTYGARVNKNVLLDQFCWVIPLAPTQGSSPGFKNFPWFYYPLLVPEDGHVVSENFDVLRTQFVSTVDTVGKDPKVKKSILLRSSQYAKTQEAPVSVSLDILRKPPPDGYFNEKDLPVAIMLEGQFTSVFKNRVPTRIAQGEEFEYKEESEPTRMIIVGDGDIARNHLQQTTYGPKPLPLSMDKFTRQMFGNTDFLLNCVNYLLGEEHLIPLRVKNIRLRPLDRQRLKRETLRWQLANTIMPIILTLMAALLVLILRKYRYGRKRN